MQPNPRVVAAFVLSITRCHVIIFTKFEEVNMATYEEFRKIELKIAQDQRSE